MELEIGIELPDGGSEDFVLREGVADRQDGEVLAADGQKLEPGNVVAQGGAGLINGDGHALHVADEEEAGFRRNVRVEAAAGDGGGGVMAGDGTDPAGMGRIGDTGDRDGIRAEESLRRAGAFSLRDGGKALGSAIGEHAVDVPDGVAAPVQTPFLGFVIEAGDKPGEIFRLARDPGRVALDEPLQADAEGPGDAPDGLHGGEGFFRFRQAGEIADGDAGALLHVADLQAFLFDDGEDVLQQVLLTEFDFLFNILVHI